MITFFWLESYLLQIENFIISNQEKKAVKKLPNQKSENFNIRSDFLVTDNLIENQHNHNIIFSDRYKLILAQHIRA